MDPPDAGGHECPSCETILGPAADYCPSCGLRQIDEPVDRCPDCGEPFAPDAKYCAHCGTARDGSDSDDPGADVEVPIYEHGDESFDERRRQAFQQRVDEFLAEGWSVKERTRTRAVVVRGHGGSILAHLLLLVVFPVLGNLLYLLYTYTIGAKRREITIQDVDPATVASLEPESPSPATGSGPTADDDLTEPSISRQSDLPGQSDCTEEYERDRTEERERGGRGR